MGPETQVRRPRERPLPDLEAEEELELGRYWHALVLRWWLPLAGLIAGIAIGYLLSLGGDQVQQGKSTIYLGQPLSPSGTGQIQGLSTNPATVKQVVLAPFWQHRAEQQAGLPSGSLRGRARPRRPEPAREHRRRRQAAGEDRPRRRRAREHRGRPGLGRLRLDQDQELQDEYRGGQGRAREHQHPDHLAAGRGT